jgi:hypothetical protein
MFIGEEEMNKNYKFKIRPYYGWIVFIFIILFAVEILLTVAISEIHSSANIILKILFVGLPILYISFVIYSMLWGWDSLIYFDDEKAYRKIRGKTYEWYYDDMVDVELKVYDFRMVRVRIKSAKHEKLLTFDRARFIIRKFSETCTNEKIVYKLLSLTDNNSYL